MPDYQLTQRANHDLRRLRRESRERWGPAHAAAYVGDILAVLDLIGSNPGIARLRTEITPPVRLHPHRAHLILYRDGPPPEILRILHHRQNWMSRL